MLKQTAFALVLLATPLTAETADPCHAIGELASTIMTHRQNGLPASVMIRAVSEHDGNELATAMILQAYGQPRMSHPDNQRRSIQDFRNGMEVACYDALR